MELFQIYWIFQLHICSFFLSNIIGISVLGLNTSQKQPRAAVHSPSPHWDWEENTKIFVRKLIVGWDKYSIIRKAKATHTTKSNKKLIHHFPWETSVQPLLGKRHSMPHNHDSEKQTSSFWTSPSSFFLSPKLSMSPYGMEFPFDQLVAAVLAECPPNFLSATSLFTGGMGWKAEKILTV